MEIVRADRARCTHVAESHKTVVMAEDNFNFEEVWVRSQQPATGRRAEAHRLATAMRRVIDHLVQVAAPEENLRAAADALEKYAERLAQYPVSRVYEGFAETANAGDTSAFFDHSPLIGLANPLAPPIRVAVVDDKVVGHANFGVAYEGPPGYVHGGLLAAAFDEVLGMAQSLTGNPGMTGTLSIRYRKPTPLLTELVFEARVTKIEGRKILTHGTVSADGVVTAEAEGLFIAIGHERFAQMAEATFGSSKKSS
jgi:acyl-coenzyme A thioesterase PaaI-like protein